MDLRFLIRVTQNSFLFLVHLGRHVIVRVVQCVWQPTYVFFANFSFRQFTVNNMNSIEGNSTLSSTIKCQSISEEAITNYFCDVKNERLRLLINEANNSIKRIEGKGLQELLNNTCLNIYIDQTSYEFKSGNGKKLIVINYENDIPVTQFVGFSIMD